MKKLISIGLPGTYCQLLLGEACTQASAKAFQSAKGYTLKDAWQQYDGLIILCEHDKDFEGRTQNRSSLSGIAIAQKLRKEGVRLPIFFLSFLGRKQIIGLLPTAGIITAVGSYFLQLPGVPKDVQQRLEVAKRLSTLEILDVQMFSCDSAGMLNELLHKLDTSLLQRALSNGGEVAVRYAIVAIYSAAFRLFTASPTEAIAQFETAYSDPIRPQDLPAIVSFVKTACQEIAAQYTTGDKGLKEDKRAWKVLVLDDELTLGDKEKKDTSLLATLSDYVKEVVCTSNAASALKELSSDDTYRGSFAVILCDYRLLQPAADMLEEHQPMQGYQFINEVAKTFRNRFTGAVIYSGLPRRFLLETSRRLGMRCEVISKHDYPPTDSIAITHLIEEILDLGDSCYEAMNSLPLSNSGFSDTWVPWAPKAIVPKKPQKKTIDNKGIQVVVEEGDIMDGPSPKTDFGHGKEPSIYCHQCKTDWSEAGDECPNCGRIKPRQIGGIWEELSKGLETPYRKYRQLSDYARREYEIDEYCHGWIRSYIETRVDNEAAGPPPSPLPGTTEFNYNSTWIKSKEDRIAKLTGYFKARRIAIWLYLDAQQDITTYCEALETYIRPAGAETKGKQLSSTYLGLAPTEFPFGLTIEELYWLESVLGQRILTKSTGNFNTALRAKWLRAEHIIGRFIFGAPDIVSSIPEDNPELGQDEQAAMRFVEVPGDAEAEDSKTARLYFAKDYRPILFGKEDFGRCMRFLHQRLKVLWDEASLQAFGKMLDDLDEMDKMTFHTKPRGQKYETD